MLFLFSVFNIPNIMQQFFAIDIGTTHCKALVTNETGRILHTAKATVISIQDKDGRYEQDAEQIFEIFIQLLKECISASAPGKIACVSFSAAMHSLLAVDNNGKPLTKAITWADTRSKQYAQQLRATAEAKKYIYIQVCPYMPCRPCASCSG